MERLDIEKQKSTIFQVSLLLIGSEHVADLQPLKELIPAVLTDLADTAEEFFNLETEVEQLEDSALKEEVLERIRAKTPIQARSEEEKKGERRKRGRPFLDL